MRDDFCAFIISHGRPDRVHTYNTLMRSGYTGKVYIVIDNEDKTGDEYRNEYGDKVLVFDKAAMDATLDTGDNFAGRTSTIWPRNALWELARQVGCRYFIQLDDDYTSFEYRFHDCGTSGYKSVRKTMDPGLGEMVQFLDASKSVSVAMSQGGDFIGGMNGQSRNRLRRKAMNSFICDTKRPFMFFGRMNEDVNTYVRRGFLGDVFFTVLVFMLVQMQTQTNSGGMSELYLDSGTYVKSFYTVMYAPSCVKIGTMGDPRGGTVRIHHKINWHNTAPKILREEWKK